MRSQQKPLTEAQAEHLRRCETVSKPIRRWVIYEAFTEGGLTYEQISRALGDIGRQRVIQIVREERARLEGMGDDTIS